MGVFTDLLTSPQTFDADSPHEGSSRSIVRILEGVQAVIGDVPYPLGYDEADEVQGVAAHVEADAGTYTLAFTLADGTEFETGNIAFDAVHATIQTAIDTAADGVVTGFTAGDIAVTGGPLSTTAIVITYSGDSVDAQNHGEVVIDDALLEFDGGGAGSGTAGAASTATNGQPNRAAWAALNVCGIISGTPPAFGTSDTVTAQNTRGNFPHQMDQDTVRALAKEAAAQDGNPDVETAILAAVGL